MAIKKLNFSFEVPITALLSLIATGNTGLKIDVLGDDKSHPIGKLLNGAHPAMKLLEGPKGPKKGGGIGSPGQPRQRGVENGQPITAYNAMMKAMGARSDHTLSNADLRALVGGIGLAPSSANSQISLMRTRGHAKRIGEGIYQLTAHGIMECEKRGFKVVGKNRKPPDKKKKSKASASAETPVAAESDHG
jgi:hypothetical protein